MYVDTMEKIKYQSYWASAKKLQTEVQLIGRLDLLNKTKFKKKYEAGDITGKEIAQFYHEKGCQYELSIFEDHEIFCHLVLFKDFMKVNFIDGNGRLYLIYLFSPSKKHCDRFFIREVWYYNYTSESNSEESYRLHFVFDEDGNVSYRKYDEVNKKFFDYESKEPSDISGLYEPYPEFEKYASLIRLERNFPLDIIPKESDETPDRPNDSDNKWLPSN